MPEVQYLAITVAVTVLDTAYVGIDVKQVVFLNPWSIYLELFEKDKKGIDSKSA